MVVEHSIRELVRDRLPEAIRGDFFKSIFSRGCGGSSAGAGSTQNYVIYGIMCGSTDSQGQILMEGTWATAIRFLYLFKMRFYFKIF